ncbi:MAG TPA: lytic transglycosylase, partial [Rhodocyclaceae bacterium]|nr:lytic transglycosylase [Rhodocyclaceae bacterium]
MQAFRHFRLILPIVALALTASGLACASGDNPLQMTSDLSTVGELASPDAKLPVLVLTPNPLLEIRDDLPPLPTIDLISPPDDLWQRLRNGFSMPDLDSPLVADRQAWYLNRPDLLVRIFERSRRYLHHIVEELEKRGMPTELAL